MTIHPYPSRVERLEAERRFYACEHRRAMSAKRYRQVQDALSCATFVALAALLLFGIVGGYMSIPALPGVQ